MNGFGTLGGGAAGGAASPANRGAIGTAIGGGGGLGGGPLAGLGSRQSGGLGGILGGGGGNVAGGGLAGLQGQQRGAQGGGQALGSAQRGLGAAAGAGLGSFGGGGGGAAAGAGFAGLAGGLGATRESLQVRGPADSPHRNVAQQAAYIGPNTVLASCGASYCSYLSASTLSLSHFSDARGRHEPWQTLHLMPDKVAMDILATRSAGVVAGRPGRVSGALRGSRNCGGPAAAGGGRGSGPPADGVLARAVRQRPRVCTSARAWRPAPGEGPPPSERMKGPIRRQLQTSDPHCGLTLLPC